MRQQHLLLAILIVCSLLSVTTNCAQLLQVFTTQQDPLKSLSNNSRLFLLFLFFFSFVPFRFLCLNRKATGPIVGKAKQSDESDLFIEIHSMFQIAFHSNLYANQRSLLHLGPKNGRVHHERRCDRLFLMEKMNKITKGRTERRKEGRREAIFVLYF